MAVYNELQVGRYVRFLQKFFGIKGRQPAPLTFSGEITAALSLFHGAENRYLEGWNRFAVGATVTSGGVSAGGLRLRNPSNSRVVAVFEKLDLESSVAADTLTYQVAAQAADLTTIGSFSNARLDARGNPTPVLIPSSFTSGVVIAGAATGQMSIAGANTPYQFISTDIQEIPLLPGDALTMQAAAITAKLTACLMWRERVLEESELT